VAASGRLPVAIKEIAEPVPDARVLIAWPRSVRLNRRADEFVRYCVSVLG
jgi:hypothetical protein